MSYMIRNTVQKKIFPGAAGISWPPAILSQKLTFSKHDIIPIDAKFYADFKNVYFYAFILNISRFTAMRSYQMYRKLRNWSKRGQN